MANSPNLLALYQSLLSEYGHPVDYWPQWCAQDKSTTDREKIILGMILVQHTSWHNANIALKNLKTAHLLSATAIANLPTYHSLTDLVRAAGFFQSKPQRIFDVCKFVVKSGGIDKLICQETNLIRSSLLSIRGIGQESADTILLYALDKPVFIVDEYTRRWLTAQNLIKTGTYTQLQEYFHSQLDPDLDLYKNLHALIIISQRGREKSRMEIV